jgi:hypothetical protein
VTAIFSVAPQTAGGAETIDCAVASGASSFGDQAILVPVGGPLTATTLSEITVTSSTPFNAVCRSFYGGTVLVTVSAIAVPVSSINT